MDAKESTRPWWKDCLFYQIYPRSFQDSDGDGFGDIPGIISRLDSLAELGVGAIWLSPMYPSPDVDNGYDIADYCEIDSRYGTLQDFDRLVAEAKRRDIRIIMDLVINHTSSAHPWFQASRAKQGKYTDYYIWRQGDPDGNSPNNWTGFFLGSAWQWDDQRGEWYLHLFDQSQPDLNYRNRDVIEEIKQVLRFWLDRGVAGFRCDVISLLHKQSFDDGSLTSPIRGLEHYKSTRGTHEILAELRRDVLDPYQAFAVGETVMVTLDEAKDFTDPARGELDEVFTFDHLEVDRLIVKYGSRPFSARRLLDRITRWQRELSWNAVYLENHDQARIVSHYGDDEKYWSRSSMALATLLLTLKGTPFLYQGQEIGMTNFDFTTMDQINDVESRKMDDMLASWHVPKIARWKFIAPSSRDNARTPMQWDSSTGAGFTTGTPWLGINANKNWVNYCDEDANPWSILNFYRRLIRFRKGSITLREGEFEPLYATRTVMAFRRRRVEGFEEPSYTILINLSGSVSSVDRVQCGEVVVSNTGRRMIGNSLKPWEAVVIAEA